MIKPTIPKPSGFFSNPSLGSNRPGWLNKIKNSSLVLPLICLILGFAGGMIGGSVTHGNVSPTAQKEFVSNESQLISSIAHQAGPSVVSVVSTQESTTQPGSYFGFGQPSQSQSSQSAGTGFVISSSGLIVTNRHVVPSGTTSVSITLADGTTYNNVQVVGRTSTDNPLDVAFLKISDLKGKKLTPLPLGDSSKMEVGDRVIAIGNALGQFQNTVTTGIISGYGRDVTASDSTGSTSENLTDLFQTDASINEGNSGGPLVNINGQVIGINTAIASGAQNIGFAIPINDVKGLINSVLSSGQLKVPYLGVRYVSITNDLAYQYNLPVSQGAYVLPQSLSGQAPVVPGGPADKAGIQGGDIITKVDNVTIDPKTSLSGALDQFSVGQTVKLTVIRGSKTITINVTLGQAPGGQAS